MSPSEFKRSSAWVALYWLSEGYNLDDTVYEMGISKAMVFVLLNKCKEYLGAKDYDELVVNALLGGYLIKRRDLNRGIDYV